MLYEVITPIAVPEEDLESHRQQYHREYQFPSVAVGNDSLPVQKEQGTDSEQYDVPGVWPDLRHGQEGGNDQEEGPPSRQVKVEIEIPEHVSADEDAGGQEKNADYHGRYVSFHSEYPFYYV